jgi:GTP-binding protein Era
MNNNSDSFRCGYVAIVGRPNVGKSTLLNRLVGQKISITAHKPQTTRHRILGIKTTPSAQIVYVDTPGIHQGVAKAMNKYMNRAASSTITDVDVVLFLVDGLKWTEEDQLVLEQVKACQHPVILVVNKIDHITDKPRLLPHLEELSQKMDFAGIIPISALKGDAVEALEQQVIDQLPESPPFFPEEQVTDRSERFIAAELVREKLMRSLGQELPYATTVEIEKFEVVNGLRRIAAVIWVERDGQKAIIIGKQGQLLKRLGMQSRKDMEQAFGGKVYLQLWVKVKQGWSDDERALRSLGYNDDIT